MRNFVTRRGFSTALDWSGTVAIVSFSIKGASAITMLLKLNTQFLLLSCLLDCISRAILL